MGRARKPVVAICYDFDGTLIRGNMQENSFIPQVGISPSKFWKAVKNHAKNHDMDEVLAYMQLMIEMARAENKPFNRQSLRDHGKAVDLFPGVSEWFRLISDYGRNRGISIQHFVMVFS